MKRLYYTILFALTMMLVGGCGRFRSSNQKADDELSRSVWEALDNDLYYLGREDTKINGTCYEYQIKNVNAEVISKFVNVISECMEGEQRRVTVLVGTEIPGGLENIFYLSNYINADDETGKIIEGSFLYIYSPRVVSGDIYFDPLTYLV